MRLGAVCDQPEQTNCSWNVEEALIRAAQPNTDRRNVDHQEWPT
jgi:hypothetical protein